MLGQLNARSSEMAVRSALGAHRSRLVQQLMIESLLVGAAAGVLGAAIGAGAFRILVRALPLGAWGESASLDWRVFATSLAIALTASLLVALVPTLSLVRGDLRGVMGTSRTGGISGRGGRMESTLVVAEVALAVLMASGAALLVRSVQHLYDIHVGVDTRGLAVLDVVTGGNLTVQQRSQQMVELVRELSSMPGVKSAAATQKLPLRGNGNNNGLAIEGGPELPGTTTYFRMVSRGYFETLGVPTLDGRTFDASDRADGETAVVVNAAFVKQFMPGVNPIGRRVNSMGDSWSRIIGVVGDVAEGQLTDAMAPARYYLDEQAPWGTEGYAIVMRARSGDPTQLLDAARRTVQRVAPSVAVQEATTMQRVVDLAVGPARQVMTLLTLLTGLALVLGAVGIYGVIAHFATRRKRDWAIQMALGLRASKVVSRVVSHGVALVAAGIVIGMIGVALLTRLLASLLYNVSAVDPISLAAASVALLAVGVIAAFLPARRAGLVDPATVLREQ
jgi:predicted permease